MAHFIERFTDDDAGNSLIDWMVLTAGLVLLGAAVVATVAPTDSAVAVGDTAIVAPINSGV